MIHAMPGAGTLESSQSCPSKLRFYCKHTGTHRVVIATRHVDNATDLNDLCPFLWVFLHKDGYACGPGNEMERHLTSRDEVLRTTESTKIV